MNIRKTVTIAAVAAVSVMALAPAAFAQSWPMTHLLPPRITVEKSPVVQLPEIGVCFYTKVNFEGNYFCDRGQRRVNEVDAKWRDRIESVQVINHASVVICEDFNRKGTCQTLTKDNPELAPELFDHLYSYKIKE
jgi:hypothetical protein